jgi:hypothetical protein
MKTPRDKTTRGRASIRAAAIGIDIGAMGGARLRHPFTFDESKEGHR